MSVRKENLVQVRDPKGEVFEVTRRNASDLVQHKGWKIIGEGADPTDELAVAGRKKKVRGEKVKAAQKEAREVKAAKKTAPVLPQSELEVDENEPTFDEQQAGAKIDDELDDLEDEEAERGKP